MAPIVFLLMPLSINSPSDLPAGELAWIWYNFRSIAVEGKFCGGLRVEATGASDGAGTGEGSGELLLASGLHESLMFGGQQRQDGVRPAILRFSIGTVDSQMTFVSGCIGCLLIHVIAYVFNEAVNCVASDFRTPGVGLFLPFDIGRLLSEESGWMVLTA